VAVIVLRRRHPYLVTGWLWYLIMLAPVVGILQVGSQARADRYTYLPQIGLLILLTWAAADFSARWRYRRLILTGGSAIALMVLTFAARTQASYWRNSQTLWTHALASTYDNVLAEEDLGQAVYENGMVGEAIAHFQRALEIDPNQASVLSSLGAALLDAGRADESLAQLQKALEIDPRDGNAHYNLANTLLHMGRADDALAHYDIALGIEPNDIQARNNAAWVLATWPDAQIRNGKKAVALAENADAFTNRRNPIIATTLAAAYAETGRFPEAVKTAERALQLATAQGDAERASSIRAQLTVYKSGLPFRDERYLSFGR
jgi:tetratricopeptide (TPR) repeat protein